MTVAEAVVAKLPALSEHQQRQVLAYIEKLEAQPQQPLIDPYGLFAGHDTTEEDITAARREMWGSFPRGDL